MFVPSAVHHRKFSPAIRLAEKPSTRAAAAPLANEDTFSIQLKDQQGNIYSFRKSDLRNLKKLRGETPMPAYASVFSSAELDDLVKFLAAQRGRP